ncbi:MAG: JmjC domain-containing protein [Bdellovibrionales bacterium]
MNNLFEKLTCSSEAFWEHYIEDKPFVVHGLNESIQELLDIPMLKSVEELFINWTYPVDVHASDVRDEIKSLTVSKDEAKELFKGGQSILFNDVEGAYPVLEPWLVAIRRALKLSQHTFSRSLVYATPEGGGNAPHFDQNINFVLQIHGEKKWWVAENSHVINPLNRHVIGLPEDPELESYSDAMPEKFPEKFEEYTLKPGSLLFVPRGAWHKTEALSDAVSLNFTFTAPAWVDLIMVALRGRLVQSEHWRETASDFTSVETLNKFDALLENLAEDASTWRASDIIEALEGEEI